MFQLKNSYLYYYRSGILNKWFASSPKIYIDVVHFHEEIGI